MTALVLLSCGRLYTYKTERNLIISVLVGWFYKIHSLTYGEDFYFGGGEVTDFFLETGKQFPQ